MAYRAGKQIIYLIKNNITARQIITKDAIKNAMKVDMAMAGSVNLLQHIPAIANEADYDDVDWWKYFDEASNDIPLFMPYCAQRPIFYGCGWMPQAAWRLL